MDAQKQNSAPKVTKESKNKIKVDFERSPLKDRLKAKFINIYFLQNVIFKLFRFVFLLGIAYIVLYPFFTKVAGSFMAPEDFVDVTVRLIPKHFTFDIYKAVWSELDYLDAFKNTLLLSLMTAILQTLVCSLIAYGLAKYKFKGNKLIFLLVVLTMIVPHKTLRFSIFMHFRYFDVLGILSFLSGGVFEGFSLFSANAASDVIRTLATEHSLNLTNTFFPMIILSITGLGFKNGLYIFMLRQFFSGIPDSLEESAYIDGSGNFRTFFQIILPISIPMMITVFLFAFCWQWTDSFYTNLFFTRTDFNLLPKIVGIPTSLQTEYAGQNLYYAAIRNTCGIMIILPLVILYVFMQRFLVEGIERSGLTAE